MGAAGRAGPGRGGEAGRCELDAGGGGALGRAGRDDATGDGAAARIGAAGLVEAGAAGREGGAAGRLAAEAFGAAGLADAVGVGADGRGAPGLAARGADGAAAGAVRGGAARFTGGGGAAAGGSVSWPAWSSAPCSSCSAWSPADSPASALASSSLSRFVMQIPSDDPPILRGFPPYPPETSVASEFTIAVHATPEIIVQIPAMPKKIWLRHRHLPR